MDTIINKVNHCLHCKNALCTRHCPVHTQIPDVITLAQNNEFEKAGKLLFENNFFSAICGLICDHKRQCYGNCILNHKNNPVPFYLLEQTISYQYLKNFQPSIVGSNHLNVAMIGAGPSAMALAYKLASKAVQVTLYDNHEHMGGVLRYGIPDFRLDKSILDLYEELLLSMGVIFKKNQWINQQDIQKIKSQYDVLVLANGAWIGKSLNESSLNQSNVFTALDVLNQKMHFDSNSKVIVIGGGNVAMDVARYCKNMCENTFIYYRKQIKDMPANVDEINDAINEGILIKELHAPLSFDDKGVVFAKAETLMDEQGKKYTKIIENSAFHVDCDIIIQAISQQVDTDLFKALNISLNQWNLVDSTKQGLTNIENVFVVGDALLGPKTLVHCMDSVNQLMEKLEDLYGIK